MDEPKTATPSVPVAGHTWTDESGLPRATNGAWTQEQTVNPAAPVMVTPATPAQLGPSEQAAEDYRQIKFYSGDQVSLRSKATARFNLLELAIYNNTLSELRRPTRPAPTRAQSARNWQRQSARKAA